jgi:membrane-associated phospholipid phosphatase
MYEDRSSRKWSISYFTVNFLLRNNKYTCIHLSIRYITNHNCNATVTASALQEARLSFPSGHSSYSTYAFVFLFVSVSILGVSGFRFPQNGNPFLSIFFGIIESSHTLLLSFCGNFLCVPGS